ncbi:MAG: translation initiation factor IF-2 [Lentisphaerae bacterium]|nr:translation initiation factor IF-2 [Lentisphaerota bacterium]
MAKNTMTVKDFAVKYKVSSQEIIKELNSQGIDTPKGETSKIPEDMIELIDAYFDDLYTVEAAVSSAVAKKVSGGNSGKKGQRRSGVEMTQQVKNKGKGKGKENASSDSKGKTITLPVPLVVKDLADAVGKKPNEVIMDLIKLGELAGINQPVSEANAKKLCANYGFTLEIGSAASAVEDVEELQEEEDPALLRERPPVVTFMGHVDHGKTSLQDAVRHTNVTAGEAGAITQHIGASTVEFNGKQITFIDTPGHAAFSSMRARGANVTDIVVLVVSAAEGFKPQTIEAMNHALAAKVPIIVAINKIDLPEADPDKILLHMQQNNLTSEDWGGTVGTVRVSAKTKAGLPDLLERILMEAEMLELKANPDKKAAGVVIEAQLEQGLGSTASVLVQDGTLRTGDIVLVGEHYGKVRVLFDDKGGKLKTAGPSTPVKLVGLSGVPEAGDKLEVCSSEREAREKAQQRIADKRSQMAASSGISSVEDLFSRLNSDEKQKHHLNIVIKSDVKGSGEAIAQSLAELPSEKIRAEVVANGVGPISDGDIELAAATGAMVVGFHVRVNPGVNDLAKKRGVEIRLYSIIYELLEDITDALAGKLEPEKREKEIGQARILQIFELSKGPKICGCRVDSGVVKVGAKARVRRNKELIYNGEVASLRHFKDDVREVKAGLECGIRLDNFTEFDVGDEIEIYEIELKKASL